MQVPACAAGPGLTPPSRSTTAVPGRSRWVRIGREFAVIILLYVAYSLSRLFVDPGPTAALENGYAVLAREQQLGLDIEQAVVTWLLESPALSIAAGYLYATLHYTVTPGVLVWLYRSHPQHYLRSRRILAIATVAAVIGYWLYPTAPPRLLTSGEFPDVLALFADWGWWGADASAPKGLGALTNEYAAMPSMHVGWALWSGVAVAVLARRPLMRALGVAYPLIITVVVIATANHYLLDAFAGAALVTAVGTAAYLVTLWQRRCQGTPHTGAVTLATEDVPTQRGSDKSVTASALEVVVAGVEPAPTA